MAAVHLVVIFYTLPFARQLDSFDQASAAGEGGATSTYAYELRRPRLSQAGCSSTLTTRSRCTRISSGLRGVVLCSLEDGLRVGRLGRLSPLTSGLVAPVGEVGRVGSNRDRLSTTRRFEREKVKRAILYSPGWHSQNLGGR